MVKAWLKNIGDGAKLRLRFPRGVAGGNIQASPKGRFHRPAHVEIQIHSDSGVGKLARVKLEGRDALGRAPILPVIAQHKGRTKTQSKIRGVKAVGQGNPAFSSVIKGIAC